MPAQGEITRILAAIQAGDRSAFDRLFQAVYEELHHSAHRQLSRRRPGDTLNTTALVHEAYLKLVATAEPAWSDRHHFFAVAARAMRQIVVDYARGMMTAKRGRQPVGLALDGIGVAVAGREPEIVALDEALGELERFDARRSLVVELRFFLGLSVEETAELLGLSERTVKREWQKARAFLYDAVQTG